MAFYKEVLDDLRIRILAGEWDVGDQLPSIADLQKHYNARSLNSIRGAQQALVEEGLLETKQGVGAFVISLVPTPLPIEAELRAAKAALAQAVASVDRSLRFITGK